MLRQTGLGDTRPPGRATPRGVDTTEHSVAAPGRVDLTPAQVAEPGDVTDVAGWARRARALMDRDGVPAAAIGRVLDMATATRMAALRRHTRGDPSPSP